MDTSRAVDFQEYRDCSELTYEWAESYDTKDWARLASIVAPTVKIHYVSVNDYHNDALPAADYVAMMSDSGFLGDPNLDTQHLVGAHRLRKVAADEIEGQWQIRAAHQRYRDEKGVHHGIDDTTKTNRGDRVVLLTGHAHAIATITYKLVDGTWKWAGLKTDIRWNEKGFDKMFTGFVAGKPAAD